MLEAMGSGSVDIGGVGDAPDYSYAIAETSLRSTALSVTLRPAIPSGAEIQRRPQQKKQ